RRALAQRAARGVQALGCRGRLGASLHDDELPGRGADRARADEVRGERHALSRLQAGNVERGGEDRAGGGGGVAWTDGSPEASAALAKEAGASFLKLKGASIVIWTTTPWTLPGNRAI